MRSINILIILRWGDTSLVKASSNGHDKVVDVLLKSGAKFHAAEKCELLRIASSKGYDKIVDVLLKSGAKVDAVDQ